MLGGFGNIVELMKNARGIQERMAEFQNELGNKRFDAETGGGMVRITVDGKGVVVDVKIDPSATADVELLEDLVKSAACAATKRAQDEMKDGLAQMTGGLNLPGLEGLLGK